MRFYDGKNDAREWCIYLTQTHLQVNGLQTSSDVVVPSSSWNLCKVPSEVACMLCQWYIRALSSWNQAKSFPPELKADCWRCLLGVHWWRAFGWNTRNGVVNFLLHMSHGDWLLNLEQQLSVRSDAIAWSMANGGILIPGIDGGKMNCFFTELLLLQSAFFSFLDIFACISMQFQWILLYARSESLKVKIFKKSNSTC